MLIFKKKLHKYFKITNEPFKKFLDIKISQLNKNIISLSQTIFIEEILKCFDMKNLTSILTFIIKSLQLDLKFTDSFLINIDKEYYQ